MSATLHHGSPVMVDHTPSSAVSAGQMVKIGSEVLVAHRDIAANELGSLAAPGGEAVYKIPLKVGAVFAAGDEVNVDVGAGTADPGDSDKFGVAIEAADQTAGATEVIVRHAQP